MNTKDKGNITEAKILAALVSAGHKVLIPWGDNLRYDLALDQNGSLVRVQCKTGNYINGAIVFATASTYAHRGGCRKTYRGQADLFGVYCSVTDEVYLVPVGDVGVSSAYLRVEPPKHLGGGEIRWAKDYEI